MKTINLLTPSGNELTAEAAESFVRRFCGLMGRRSLPRGSGLLLAPCNSIHMLFMRFAIDAVFLDKEYRIKKIAAKIRPWMGMAWCPGASACLELNAGEAAELQLTAGQKLMAAYPLV